jgi:hypothetical protein
MSATEWDGRQQLGERPCEVQDCPHDVELMPDEVQAAERLGGWDASYPLVQEIAQEVLKHRGMDQDHRERWRELVKGLPFDRDWWDVCDHCGRLSRGEFTCFDCPGKLIALPKLIGVERVEALESAYRLGGFEAAHGLYRVQLREMLQDTGSVPP